MIRRLLRCGLIITGFGWLTAVSAPALRRIPAGPAS
jgi:hypothetical protein